MGQKYIIHPGDKFNRWTVLEVNVYNPNSKAKKPLPMNKCQCECGTIRYKESRDLVQGRSQSCGCLRREELIEMNNKKGFIPIGTRFGKLTVIADLGYKTQLSGRKIRFSKCQCDCGTIVEVANNNLKSGGTQSCGCVKSRGETIIRKLLIQYNINFSTEYTFPDLVGERGNYYRFDFAIFDKNNQLYELIEFDGRQHYTGPDATWSQSDSLETIQKRDKIKTEYCIQKNIKLIRVPYYEINKITLKYLQLEELVK